MYRFARGSRVEAPTIGIISIGWADFRLILVSRAPTYYNHANILCSCNARSPSPLHPLIHPVPPHPPTPPSPAVSSNRSPCLSPHLGSRSMPSSAADNSIILHAKTASDVLAQSASHLCEQITSYRKIDFIFEGRYLRYFFPTPCPALSRTSYTVRAICLSVSLSLSLSLSALCSPSFILYQTIFYPSDFFSVLLLPGEIKAVASRISKNLSSSNAQRMYFY